MAVQQRNRVGLVDEMEAALARLVFVDVGFLDVEIPAVQAQAAARQALLYLRVRLQMLELLEYVELGELVVALEVVSQRGARARVQLLQAALTMTEPAVQRRHIARDLSSCQQGIDSAALGMSADNDVGDGQIRQGELNGSSFRSEMGRLIAFREGRNEIADIADDEHVARLGGGEHIRGHTAVGTGDEECIGPLTQG